MPIDGTDRPADEGTGVGEERFSEGSLSGEDLAGRAALFKALGDPTRLKVLEVIASEPDVCACGLLERLHISQSTLSHHAKILCSSGLVECEKRGRWAHYRLCPGRLDEARRYFERLRELAS